MWIVLGVLLVATVFVRNLYCRFLCPVGASLGLLSKPDGVPRSSDGRSARPARSARRPASGARFAGRRSSSRECVRCDDCERLYMDTEEVPALAIMIRKKSDIMARQSAVASTVSRSLRPDEIEHLVLRRRRSPLRRPAAAR